MPVKRITVDEKSAVNSVRCNVKPVCNMQLRVTTAHVCAQVYSVFVFAKVQMQMRHLHLHLHLIALWFMHLDLQLHLIHPHPHLDLPLIQMHL